MTGAYSRRSRVGGEDRFYSPPAMRRQNHHRQQLQQPQQHKIQQQEQKQLKLGPQKRAGPGSVSGSDDGASASSSSSVTKTTTTTTRTVPSASPRVENVTNLDRFVEHTTPSVPAQFFSKTSMREWRNHDGEFQPYFILGDLWESFKEWSAYGAGVPLILNGSDSVVQYYVPYLSGIQLYIDPSRPVMRQRRPGEESDADSSRETCSNDSGDLGAEGGITTFQGTQGHGNCANTIVQGLNSISLTTNPLKGLSAEENEINNPPGLLVFEYLERDQPYSREPLADKISDLASRFPDLKTYRSCDLTTASWLSVAWYPIYRIPMGPTLQSLDACFLTYHSLSTPLSSSFADNPQLHGSTVGDKIQDSSMSLKLSLPTFGLASYKFKISFWNCCGDYECQKFNSLLQFADNWLRLLQVNHPDYRFFVSHNSYWW